MLFPLSSANTFKGSALFLGFFGLQFLLAPDFLFSENFQQGSYNLDRWHYFICHGCGCVLLSSACFYWTAADDADKFMLLSTLTFGLTSIMLPYNAQMNFPVNMPKHLIPVVGCTVLLLAHINCLLNGGGKDKKN